MQPLHGPRNYVDRTWELSANYSARTFPCYRAKPKMRTHCCGHIVADTKVSPFARARNICCGHKFSVRNTKLFLIFCRNILCPQQMFPSLCSTRNIMGNNVSATMCPRLPGPLAIVWRKPWVTDQRWKIQGDVLHGILPKNTVSTSATLRVYGPPKVPLRNSQTIFRFRFFSRKQTHTVCNNRPDIVDLSYRGRTAKLHFGLAR